MGRTERTTETMNIWTQEQIDSLTDMVRKGMSGPEICFHLGRSRGSVLSQANRLGLRLAHRVSPAAIEAQGKPPRDLEGGMGTAPEGLLRNVSLLDLERNQCRWIASGRGTDALFCGAPTDEGKTYCRYHHSRAYDKRRAGDV